MSSILSKTIVWKLFAGSPREEFGSQMLPKGAASTRGDEEGSAFQLGGHPVFPERQFKNGGSQRSSEMRATFTPIKAGARELTPGSPERVYIDAETAEHLFAKGGQSVCIVASQQPPSLDHPIVKGYTENSCYVVVAGPRSTEPVGCTGLESLVRSS